MSRTKSTSDFQIIKRLLAYLKGENKLLSLTIICLIIFGIAAAYAPSLLAKAFDQNISQGDYKGLTYTMLMLLGVYIVSLVTFKQQLIWLGTLGQKILVKLRLDIFANMQQLPLSFYHNNEPGDLMSRLINDTNSVGTLFQQSIAQTLGSIISLVAILIAMFLMDWRLATATCSVIPLMVWLSIYFSKKSRKAFAKSRKSLGDLSSNLEENLRMIRESQAFVRQGINVADFEVGNAYNRDANIEAIKITAVFSPSIDILSTLAQIAVVGVGGYLAYKNLTSVGVVVAFLAYSQRFYRPIQMLSTFYNQLQDTLASAERIFAIVDAPIEDQHKNAEITLQNIKGNVSFKNVTFGYDANTSVLKNISFEANAGETIALIGETGVGKSTTINLIPRYYEAQKGSVTIDGIDVKKIQLSSLRKPIAEVPQSAFLFSESIANNISYGDSKPNLNRIIEAAKLAQVHNFISQLPNGYKTIYGADGAQFSLGQKQLLCIARAIYANPSILLLDEATSSIDTQTETLVQTAITKVLKGRTAFVIAHRLNTIKNADKIIVLGKEGIIEQGNHKTLLQHNGYYKKMLEKQKAL